jgi:type VI secretion system protein ImpB
MDGKGKLSLDSGRAYVINRTTSPKVGRASVVCDFSLICFIGESSPSDRHSRVVIAYRELLNREQENPMARQSAQHKLDRVRPPRVQITYDVEIGGAIEIKELPFVVGVLGDFTGQPEQPLPRLKDRKFVEVNPDNFDTVLEGMKPHLSFAVENKLSDDPNGPQLKVDLHFKQMEDFEPGNVAKQVKPLKELLALRTRLADLRGTLQGNDKLEELLLDAVGNTEKLDKLKGEMGTKEGGSNG